MRFFAGPKILIIGELGCLPLPRTVPPSFAE